MEKSAVSEKRPIVMLMFFSFVCFFGIFICIYYLAKLYIDHTTQVSSRLQYQDHANNLLFFKERPALLFGYITLDALMTPVAGGIIDFDGKKTVIDYNGKFLIDDLKPGEQEVHLFYKNAEIYTGKIDLTTGINQFNIKINKVIPDFMVKQITEETPEEELFQPVTPKIYYRGNTELKRVALTIDDGWIADWKLLELFEKYKVRCTVFVIGGRGICATHPEYITKMDEMGFEVCSHTYTHATLTRLKDEKIREEVRKGQLAVSKITGKMYPYMRPSGGAHDNRVLKEVAANGQKMIIWSNSIQDTTKSIKTADQVKGVMKNLKNGDIILCHFNGYHTYNVLQTIIPLILEQGYTLGTLSEVLEGMEIE